MFLPKIDLSNIKKNYTNYASYLPAGFTTGLSKFIPKKSHIHYIASLFAEKEFKYQGVIQQGKNGNFICKESKVLADLINIMPDELIQDILTNNDNNKAKLSIYLSAEQKNNINRNFNQFYHDDTIFEAVKDSNKEIAKAEILTQNIYPNNIIKEAITTNQNFNISSNNALLQNNLRHFLSNTELGKEISSKLAVIESHRIQGTRKTTLIFMSCAAAVLLMTVIIGSIFEGTSYLKNSKLENYKGILNYIFAGIKKNGNQSISKHLSYYEDKIISSHFGVSVLLSILKGFETVLPNLTVNFFLQPIMKIIEEKSMKAVKQINWKQNTKISAISTVIGYAGFIPYGAVSLTSSDIFKGTQVTKSILEYFTSTLFIYASACLLMINYFKAHKAQEKTIIKARTNGDLAYKNFINLTQAKQDIQQDINLSERMRINDSVVKSSMALILILNTIRFILSPSASSVLNASTSTVIGLSLVACIEIICFGINTSSAQFISNDHKKLNNIAHKLIKSASYKTEFNKIDLYQELSSGFNIQFKNRKINIGINSIGSLILHTMKKVIYTPLDNDEYNSLINNTASNLNLTENLKSLPMMEYSDIDMNHSIQSIFEQYTAVAVDYPKKAYMNK